jgi:hypothetical protein
VDREFDGERARLDELGPAVDAVELRKPVHSARVDGDELDEVPVLLDGQRDPLLVRERPHDGGVD